MKSFRRTKPKQRFYLLPGQGGEAFRRKQRYMLTWSVVTALLVSSVVAALLYWMNHKRH